MSVFSRYRLVIIFLLMLVTVAGCRLISFSDDDSFPSIGAISGKVIKNTSDTNMRLVQGTVSGVADAEVWLEELPLIRTRTDADGNFTLTGVPNGTFHIVARYFNGGIEMKFRLATPVVVNGDTPQTVAEIKPLPARVKITGILLGTDENPLPTGTKLYIWGEPFEIQEGGRFETPFLPEGFLENEIYFPGIGGQPECRIPVLFGQSDPPVFSELKIFPYGQHPPAVGISVSDGTKITSSVPVTGRLTLTQYVYDRVDQEKVTTQWSASRGLLSDTASPGIKIWTPPVDGGVATVTLKATDGEGYSGTSRVLVTVIGRLSSEKSISAFAIANPAVTASISGTAITATVPFGTDRNGLKAVFTASANATVKVGEIVQTSNTTTNDFTSPVTYTVVAEDGSSQDYTITVNIAPNTAKDITAFSFAAPAGTASISGTAITATVPFGTDRNGLKAVFTASANATVKVGEIVQTSNTTTNDFTAPVTYTVVAEDGSSQDYTVTVNIAPNNAKDITAFSFAAPAVTASISGTAITATVPFGTDRNGLKAVFTSSANATVKVGSAVQTSNTTTNDFTAPVTYTVVAEDGSSQNYTVTVSIAANTAKDITAFSFASPAVTATISGTAITATVPFGTDRNGLQAVFTASANATVKVGSTVQTSNTTTNDFTAPVTYTVVAEDGSSQNYTVTVSIAPNIAKEITAFSFASPAVTASISGTAITATVPFGTDRNGLQAVFTASANATVKVGATVQTSGTTANDFSAPVTYTVVAEDGSSQDYTVTVNIAPNTAKDITAFSFAAPAVTASISGTAITATVPFGTDRNGLQAVFTASANATVKVGSTVQTSNTTTNDFTAPVTYTVVAEDGSSQDYTVTVNIAQNTAKEITAFSFASPAVTASISGTAITATVPFGTDRNGLQAVFMASANATVKVGATVQTSGTTANDFTSPVTYTVVAEDGSSQSYTVTVSIAPNTAKDITAFSFASPVVTASISGTAITATVPFGTDRNGLQAVFTASANATVKVGATVQTSGTTANDFSAPVTYTVVAEDGSSQNYTVTVSIAPNTAKDITAFSFASPVVTASISGTAITASVPFGTDRNGLQAVFTASANATVKFGATVQTSGTTANDFTSPVTYTVVAEDGSSQNYTVTVSIAPNTAKDITAFSFASPAVTASISGTAITATVPFGTDRNGLQAVFTASANATVKVGATVQTSGTTANDFTSPVTYTVVAEDGSSQNYTVTISIAANTAKDITAFSFASPAVTASISGTAITASVPFGTDRNGLQAVFTASANATVKVGATVQTSGTTANDFSAPVTYTVVAEDGSSQNYTVTVSIAPNTAKDITAFSFASPAVTASISGTAITATVPFGTDRNGLQAVFTASANATVKVGATVQTSGTTANDFTSPVTYTVVAEDGSSQNYTVTVSVANPVTVTINQKVGQSDPSTGTVDFTVVFSASVTGFDETDVDLTGTTAGGTRTVTVTGSDANWEVRVALSGAVTSGIVKASIAAGSVQDSFGSVNTVSTSTDDSVTIDPEAPTVASFNPANGSTNVSANAMVITFSENVYLGSGNIELWDTGSSSLIENYGVNSAYLSVSGNTVTINSTMTSKNGKTVAVKIPATAFRDAAGNYYSGIANLTTWSFQINKMPIPTPTAGPPTPTPTGF